MEIADEITEEGIQCGCPLNNLAQEMASVGEGFRFQVGEVYRSWRESIESAFLKGQEKRICKKRSKCSKRGYHDYCLS